MLILSQPNISASLINCNQFPYFEQQLPSNIRPAQQSNHVPIIIERNVQLEVYNLYTQVEFRELGNQEKYSFDIEILQLQNKREKLTFDIEQFIKYNHYANGNYIQETNNEQLVKQCQKDDSDNQQDPLIKEKKILIHKSGKIAIKAKANLKPKKKIERNGI
ncbi:MAG: hypothetical protein EZS28_016032 [Streblomastix strix]|uniref:Uncharacterized protein n=1 Tax=Streblomastix strix TaxID=222440 RepID=A0A5J4W0X7_9EUKA|nr:MAG: hypothetical protein EZS28_016032 [Streblomastix strix]